MFPDIPTEKSCLWQNPMVHGLKYFFRIKETFLPIWNTVRLTMNSLLFLKENHEKAQKSAAAQKNSSNQKQTNTNIKILPNVAGPSFINHWWLLDISRVYKKKKIKRRRENRIDEKKIRERNANATSLSKDRLPHQSHQASWTKDTNLPNNKRANLGKIKLD